MNDDMDEKDATVLVVDDQSDLLSLYVAWLAESYDVRSATSGEEALELIDDTVDVALIDRRMPGMPGDELLEAIRDRGVGCRVAMITAVEPDTGIIDIPFDDYLIKPIDGDEIRSTVDILVQRRDYDEKSQEFFALAAKRTAIENADRNHTNDPEYEELLARMEELQESIDATLSELGPDDHAETSDRFS
ncbi:MAG: response regulator transcription factor [Halobacteriales archaeon]